jgi:hypothetical protein
MAHLRARVRYPVRSRARRFDQPARRRRYVQTTAAAGAQSVTLPHLTDADTLNAPTVTVGAVTVVLPHLDDTDTLNAPTITTGVTIVLPHLTDSDTLNAPSITVGAVTVTLPHISDGDTLNAPTIVTFSGTYPAEVSGRYLLDQNGGVYLAFVMSSWAMANNLSDADITTALEGVAANGFNGVTVWIGGSIDIGTGWHKYENAAADDFWTGTPWASSLGAAWSSVDHIVSECSRLGLVLHASLCGGFGSTGCRADWEAATNGNMYDAGVAVATRYLSYPNIVWHVMFDGSDTPGSTSGQRVEAFFEGVNDTEGASTRPVRWMESNLGSSADSNGWLGTAGEFNPTIEGWYDYDMTAAEIAEASWANVAGPIGDSEAPYDGHPSHFSGNMGQQLRERSYATFLEGGCLINYGHEDWYPFGAAPGVTSTESLDWEDVPAHVHTVEQSYAWSVLTEFVADATWLPTDWIVTGDGSGDTKAAQGVSDSALLAYFPNSRTLSVDTTTFTGAGQVRLRWYDPMAGTYSTIAAAEAQNATRSVSFPSNHADGTSDWLLVVDAADVQAITLPHLDDTDTLNAPTVAPGAVTVTLPHLTDADTLNAPTVAPGAVTVTLPHLDDTDVLNAPTVAGQGAVALPHIDDTDTLNAPTITTGAVTVTLPHITDSDTLNAPTITTGVTLLLPHLDDADTLNAPTVTVTAVTITLPHLASATVLTPPSLLSNLWALEFPAISSRVPGVIYSTPSRIVGGS